MLIQSFQVSRFLVQWWKSPDLQIWNENVPIYEQKSINWFVFTAQRWRSNKVAVEIGFFVFFFMWALVSYIVSIFNDVYNWSSVYTVGFFYTHMAAAVADCFSSLKSFRKTSPYFVAIQLGSSIDICVTVCSYMFTHVPKDNLSDYIRSLDDGLRPPRGNDHLSVVFITNVHHHDIR